jgi:hypothetical protein
MHFTAGANTLGSLLLDSNASVTLLDSLKLTAGANPGVLTLNYGAVLNTGGLLKLLSDTLGTARLGNIEGTINGNVTCQQYVQGGRRAYRLWAHPFSTYIPLSQIQNSIDVTGVGGAMNGFVTTASNAPSVYWYHTTLGNSTLPSDPGWKPFNSCFGSVDSNRFKRYEGIRLYIRGAKGEGLAYLLPPPSPVTISMWGPVNYGNQGIVLSKGSDTTKDYNLIGNPYASPVDIGTVIATAKDAGLIRGIAFYVWNPYRGTAGAFEPKIIGAPYVIQAYNSFQVRAAVNGATLSFSESNKAASAPEVLLKAEPQYMALQVYDANYHPWDITYFNFNDDAADAELATEDAGKLSNPGLNFYSLSPGAQMLSIDARPYRDGGTIPLGLSCNYAQAYIIKAEQKVLPAGGKAYLYDKYAGKQVLLEQGTEYKFEVTDDMATQGNARFELRMGDAYPQAAKGLGLSLSPNPATDEISIAYHAPGNDGIAIRVVDMAGVSVYNQHLPASKSGITKLNVEGFAPGLYIVELSSGCSKISERFTKE